MNSGNGIYDKIKIMLEHAKKLHKEGEITDEEYQLFLNKIEEEFLTIKKKRKEEEVKRIVNDFLNNLQN